MFLLMVSVGPRFVRMKDDLGSIFRFLFCFVNCTCLNSLMTEPGSG